MISKHTRGRSNSCNVSGGLIGFRDERCDERGHADIFCRARSPSERNRARAAPMREAASNVLADSCMVCRRTTLKTTIGHAVNHACVRAHTPCTNKAKSSNSISTHHEIQPLKLYEIKGSSIQDSVTRMTTNKCNTNYTASWITTVRVAT